MEPQNPTVPTPPPQPPMSSVSPVEVPGPKKNVFVIVLLAVLLLIATFTSVFFFLQTQKLSKQLANLQAQVVLLASPQPTTEAESSTTDQKTNTNTKTLNYQIPLGWQIVNDKDNIFSIGLDPNKYNPNPSNSRIDLNSKQCCSSVFLKILPYDGGSKRGFISNNSSAIKTSSTTEQEYLVNGKPGLVLYDFDASGSNTAGMVVLDQNLALLIESQTSSKTFIEQILSTFKFLNTNNPLGQYCAGPNNLQCPAGYACKLNIIGDIASGGKCVNESETNP